jgi:hypothetical protein
MFVSHLVFAWNVWAMRPRPAARALAAVGE